MKPVTLAHWLVIASLAPAATLAANHHVSSFAGDDANPGTEARPWKTLTRANAAVSSLKPGDHLLLRRGGTWSGEILAIQGVAGTAAAPIVVGAYGPETEAHPSIGPGRVSVTESEHVVIRELEVHHSPAGPCIAVSHSGYVTVMNNVVHHAKSNGIAYHTGAHHTVTFGNVIHDVLANDGISIHDANWGPKPGPVGSHHWVIDNLLPGNYREDAIDAATEDSQFGPAAQDIKIIGNRIYGARLAGIVVQHQCRYTWVLGNTIMACGSGGAKALSLGKDTGDGTVKASGNLLIHNPRSIRLRDRAEFRHNTILHRDAGPVIQIHGNANHLTVEQNLILSSQIPWVEVHDALLEIGRVQIDANWYHDERGSVDSIGAAFRYKSSHTLTAWQTTLGCDTHSRFGPVPGIRATDELPTDVRQWDAAFFARFVPEKSWPGHAQSEVGVGAFGPDGRRHGLEIAPFSGYQENDGYGWPGTKLVQQRYPLTKRSK